MQTAGKAALALTCALIVATAAPTAVAAQVRGSSGQAASQTNLPEAPQPSPDRDGGGQSSNPAAPGEPANSAPPSGPATAAPPRSSASPPEPSPNPGLEGKPEQSSSSDQARGDISPPKEDELAHPETGVARDWDPLRAMKDVEVGTYYYKAGNYKAAISRFREALEFKPRDAIATFKLAQALEKDGELDQARAQYEAYLTILHDGPNAGEARKALERLRTKQPENAR